MASDHQLVVGFLGLGIMGTAMARNLLKSGKFAKVILWNRTSSKCDELVSEGASSASSPAEVIQAADITFAMLADPNAATEAVFGDNGVLAGISAGKRYVDMSTVDEHTSKKIGEAITAAGGVFLEAPVSGSKKPAIDGQLIILAAGDKALYDACESAFAVMGKRSLYLGAAGQAARMKLVVNMVMGSMMGAFCEGLALAEHSGLQQSDLIEVLGLGAMANPMFAMKGPSILQANFAPAFPLKHQQKDMRLAIELGGQLNQALPIATAANEVYKAALPQHGDSDFSAVYTATVSKFNS